MTFASRRTLSCATVCVALVATLSRMAFTLEVSPLTFVNRASRYVAPTYSSVGAASYVFFAGEPIRFDIVVFNSSEEVRELRPLSSSDDTFTFAARADGVLFSPRVVVAPEGYIEGIGLRETVVLGQAIVIHPGHQILFQSEIDRSDLGPGRYRIDIGTRMVDDRGRSIRPQGSIIDFEIRDLSTPQAVADAALRKGYRAYLAGQNAAAEAVADALLRTNPNSYGAMVLKGHALEKRNPEATSTLYRAALAVVEQNGDGWCAQCSDERVRSHVAEGLRCLIRGRLCD